MSSHDDAHQVAVGGSRQSAHVFVDNADSLKLSRHASLMLAEKKGVLLMGVAGPGKSAIARRILESEELEEYGKCINTLTGRTVAASIRDRVDRSLVRRRRGEYVPSSGSGRLVVTVDDLHMSSTDDYGGRGTCELLRQLVSEGGYHDTRKLTWKRVHGVSLLSVATTITATASSGGGDDMSSSTKKVNNSRTLSETINVPARLARHFGMMALCVPGDEVMTKILTTLSRTMLARGPTHLASLLLQPIALATADLVTEVLTVLPPVPSRWYCTPSLRDAVRIIEGMSQADLFHLRTGDAVAELWSHEASRVFSDRLSSRRDRNMVESAVRELLPRCFKYTNKKRAATASSSSGSGLGGAYPDDEEAMNSMPIFTHIVYGYGHTDLSSESKYAPVEDGRALRITLESRLAECQSAATDASNAAAAEAWQSRLDNLVFFEDAVRHIARISRILRFGGGHGHAFLVGVGGVGKRSLARFAAWLHRMKVVEVELALGSSHETMRESLRTAVRFAVDAEPRNSGKNKGSILLEEDSTETGNNVGAVLVVGGREVDAAHEDFIDDIACLMRGEVQCLFKPEEMEQIVYQVEPRLGKYTGKWPHSPQKSYAGTAAFVASTLVGSAYLHMFGSLYGREFLGAKVDDGQSFSGGIVAHTLLISTAASLVESLPFSDIDNITLTMTAAPLSL